MHRKPIFDVVRKLLGRGFRRREIAALDAAIDAAINAAEVTSPVSPQNSVTSVTYPRDTHTVSEAGIALIKRFEGLAHQRSDGLVEAYPDPATGGAPWTIGWGATGPDIRRGTVWTRAQCDARLVEDIERHAADVRAAIGDAPTTQGQFDALVSFHYNTGAIHRATLTCRHRTGEFERAAAEFARWNRAAGRILAGLARRRAEEASLYLS